MNKKNVLLLAVLCVFSANVFAGYKPEFTPAECPKSAQDLFPADATPVCGYVAVPLYYDGKQADKTLQLDLAILKTKNPNPQSPILFLEGGPGGNGLIPHDKNLYALLKDRDVILFSQRGTGFARDGQPAQDCADIPDIFSAPLPDVLKGCRKHLIDDERIDLAAYTTENSVEDINNVRLALKEAPQKISDLANRNYNVLNIYSVSYGTLLALKMVEKYPGTIHSIILDSTLSPDAQPLVEGGKYGLAAIEHFAADCNNDHICNHYFPDLKQKFFAVAEKVQKTPINVTFPWNGQSIKQTIGMEQLMDAINNNYDGLPYLPAMIDYLARNPRDEYKVDSTNDSAYILFSHVFPPLELASGQFSFGNFWSVACQGFFSSEREVDVYKANQNLPPVIKDFYNDYAKENIGGCRIWLNIKDGEDLPLDVGMKQPVYGATPILILAGEYDGSTNGTPPAWGQSVVRLWQGAKYFYTFPRTGHEVFRAGECPIKIASDFLNNPDQEPDKSCIDQMRAQPREFYVPENAAGSDITPSASGGFTTSRSSNNGLWIGAAAAAAVGAVSLVMTNQ